MGSSVVSRSHADRSWFEPAPGCRKCSRLTEYRKLKNEAHPEYFGGSVASWGAQNPELLIVGLAPGLHGAHRTGIPFVGDASGDFLFQHLKAAGWLSLPPPAAPRRPVRITNAVRCLPPENKPVGAEVQNCNPYLRAELKRCQGVVLALGTIAHDAILSACGLPRSKVKFAHNALHQVQFSDRKAGTLLVADSYHCSRYNTQTRRLTSEMFDAVLQRIDAVL